MKHDPLFRYLEKYVGTYRVKAAIDPTTGEFPKDSSGKIPETFEDLYIECSKGEIRHTYEEGMLAWFCFEKIKTANSVAEQLKAKGVDIIFDDCGEDAIIYFHEDDLKKVASVVKPKTNGKTIKPFSVKNLPKNKQFVDDYVIPQEDIDKLNSILIDCDKTQKLHLMGNGLREFDKVIMKKMGKDYNLTEIRNDSGLKPKLFIHSIGLWDDFLKFMKKKVKETTTV